MAIKEGDILYGPAPSTISQFGKYEILIICNLFGMSVLKEILSDFIMRFVTLANSCVLEGSIESVAETSIILSVSRLLKFS